MQFAYRLIEDFPPLAWVATCQPGVEAVVILHGRFVETLPHFFVEGAWAGNFAEGQIHNADTVFGSGGVLGDGAVTFVSCTATTDYLYHSDDVKHFVIANSLPLLLARLGDALQPACEDYSRINMSILDGIHDFISGIPTRKGHVRRVLHSNVHFGPEGISLAEKPLPPGFPQFEEYRGFMQNRIGSLFANARDPARHMPMHIYSTQSKGYDSTAFNALAASYGIDKVFTSPASKENRSFYLGISSDQPNDDGTAICMALGLICTPIDRLAFKSQLVNEHYYWASLDNNQDLNLNAIHEQETLRPFLLLTGFFGDVVYGDKGDEPIDSYFQRTDQSGLGLGELRVHCGFVQAAVPYIGARRRPDLFRITHSDEMGPWRLNNNYDRPIPRRIAEEAGVPREMFGQTKLASIVHLPSPNVPVTAALRSEFFGYLRQQGLISLAGILLLPFVQRLNNWIYWDNPSRYFYDRRKHPLLWYFSYACARLFGKPLLIRMLWTR
ncbi:MAG: hypothetical protein C3F18_09560, partial [Nitrosomonadales bacterium]